MTVYIEYAFLQNFALDGAILSLAFFAARRKLQIGNFVCAACLGAVFAIIYPLLVLPSWAAQTLKFSYAALMCLVAFGKVKNKNEWGRYAFICTLFYVFTFAVGGALTAIALTDTHVWVMTGIALLFIVVLHFVARILYKKRALHRYIYACEVVFRQKKARVLGFLDSGNTASKNGLPVCFVSPDIFYDLFGDAILYKETGQVCDEIAFETLSGIKKTAVYLAEISVETPRGKMQKQQAYFASSTNMLNREYDLLLNGTLLDKDG